MRGNTAIFKCQIPPFVTDHVDIIEWKSTENDTYSIDSQNGYGADKTLIRKLTLFLSITYV